MSKISALPTATALNQNDVIVVSNETNGTRKIWHPNLMKSLMDNYGVEPVTISDANDATKQGVLYLIPTNTGTNIPHFRETTPSGATLAIICFGGPTGIYQFCWNYYTTTRGAGIMVRKFQAIAGGATQAGPWMPLNGRYEADNNSTSYSFHLDWNDGAVSYRHGLLHYGGASTAGLYIVHIGAVTNGSANVVLYKVYDNSNNTITGSYSNNTITFTATSQITGGITFEINPQLLI